MTATGTFYCGQLFHESWVSSVFQVPITVIDRETRWDSLEYDQALKEALAEHNTQCEAAKHDIRTGMDFHY